MDDDEHLDPARVERRDLVVQDRDRVRVVLPGRRLEVLCDGYLRADPAQLKVTARATVSTGDIALLRSPTISGSVLDGAGAPVSGARVWGWPERGGTGAGASTEPDI